MSIIHTLQICVLLTLIIHAYRLRIRANIIIIVLNLYVVFRWGPNNCHRYFFKLVILVWNNHREVICYMICWLMANETKKEKKIY